MAKLSRIFQLRLEHEAGAKLTVVKIIQTLARPARRDCCRCFFVNIDERKKTNVDNKVITIRENDIKGLLSGSGTGNC